MHGKNIPGAHWIVLDFGKEIVVDHIVLDWEAAYADKYRIEGSLTEDAFDEANSDQTSSSTWTLFDANDPQQRRFRSVVESGQSPGVKTKTPLHVVHTLTKMQSRRPKSPVTTPTERL